MQMRQEQQKAQYLMGSTAFPFMGNQGSPVHIPGHNNYQSFGYNQVLDFWKFKKKLIY